ncbi:MAG: thioesterase [bacterium]
MYYEKDFEIYYKDTTNNENRIRLDILLLLLQEAAILHSEKVGFTEEYMAKNSCGWVLNKLSLEISSLPIMREKIRIKTWSRGVKSFKAYRDFEIYRDNVCIGRASTQWFFIDSLQKKLKKIPEEVKGFYGELAAQAGINLDALEIKEGDCNEVLTKEHTLRACDIDSNGHLNNTVYAQFVTDLMKNLVTHFTYNQFNIIYKKEIPYAISTVTCGISKVNEQNYNFRIYKGDTVYAAGEIGIVF